MTATTEYGIVAEIDIAALDAEAVAVDQLVAESEGIDRDLTRFNPFHAPPGSAAGGQFATQAGASGGAGDGADTAKQARAKRLRARAAECRQRAKRLRAELSVALRQLKARQHAHRQAAASAKHQAAQAKHQHAKATAATKNAQKAHQHRRLHTHHRKMAAHHRRTAAGHHKAALGLNGRIAQLRTEIHGLMAEAAKLDAQAAQLVSRTAETAAASTVHHPIGRPGGPGLFGVAGMQLPAYIQNVRDGLMKSGKSESQATQMAIGIVRNWAEGHDGHGNKVSAEVQAAATKAIAEYEADRARAKATRSDVMSVNEIIHDTDGLDASWDGDHADLPDLAGLDVGDIAAADGGDGEAARYAQPKLGSGGRFAKLKAGLAAKGASNPGALAAFIGRKKYGKGKFMALAKSARKRKAPQPAMARSLLAGELFRAFPLEVCEIDRSDRSGRVVEAYAAVFSQETEIHDHEGDYVEDIADFAFNKRLADLERAKEGLRAVKVIYNHGLTIHGTPAERFSIPVAVPELIKAEPRGLLTRSRYLNTPLADEILEAAREGALTTQSFTGRIVRSNPQLRPGQVYRASYHGLPKVTRQELGLREFGLCPFPAYQAAEVVGVRMTPVGTWSEENADADDNDVTFYDYSALPPDGEAAPGEPVLDASRSEGHSDPSVDRRLFLLRLEDMASKAGIALRERK